MITKIFEPDFDSNIRFGYHDNQTWKRNEPLSINKSIVEKYVTVPRYKYDFSFGRSNILHLLSNKEK